jgi:hypothetical protein
VRVGLLVLVACGSPPPELPWTEFYGIQYQVPPGTDVRETRSVLPGPGGLGGSPTDERPYVTLVGGHSFYVTITKTQERSTLEGKQQSYLANHIGSNHTGKATPTGWEMTYRTSRGDDATKLGTVVLIYADLAGGHYECMYDDQNSREPAVADAICRSMRVKP